ncbi:MAG: phosphatase PAP2 family protein [Candidatus Eremiobacteraeota bacterium]|nr:phosphatase PAP2 family protein [Candidatus Eremiobacteraeota bacterium]
MTSARSAALVAVAVLLVVYFLLGFAVSSRPPGAIDREAAALVGTATPLAAFLTSLGRFPAYGSECAVILIAGFVRRIWLGRCLTGVALLIIATICSNVLKELFRRPRPAHWIVTHETTYSYASGHCTNSIVFFGFWAYVSLRSALPALPRVAIAVALLVLSGGIGWSRLALGAHYPTDVLGGYLLGAAILELAITFVPQHVLGFVANDERAPA